MNQFAFLSDSASATGVSGAYTLGSMVIWILIMVVAMYFIAIRPQKKQQKKQEELVNSLAIGDSVLTTAGFYGVVIDVMEEVIIVEFGNNKNCRIPMKKQAVVEVEKPLKDEEK